MPQQEKPELPGELPFVVKDGPLNDVAAPGVGSLCDQYSGRWIAWNPDGETIAAVADTYGELMKIVADKELIDPAIEKAPGIHPALASRPFELMQGESADILQEIRQTIPDPDQWLDTPNARLWCQKPRELIGTSQEPYLRSMLRGIGSGITS
jgi:hypothetical protein